MQQKDVLLANFLMQQIFIVETVIQNVLFVQLTLSHVVYVAHQGKMKPFYLQIILVCPHALLIIHIILQHTNAIVQLKTFTL